MGKQTICLDFDGVVHSYISGWKGAANIPDDPVPGAMEFIVTSLDHYRVAIFSSRSHQWGGRRAMRHWLHRHLVTLGVSLQCPQWWLDRIDRTAFADPWPDEVEWASDRVVREIEWPLFKPAAVVSIDDRAIQFTGTFPSLDDIRSFKPWNKKG